MCADNARPAPHLEGADWLSWPETRAVFAALAGEGAQTRAVGGAVRDTLLARPVCEVDLATTASPHQVMARAERAGLRAVATGIDHGTVTVVAGGRPFEVTTLRTDVETYGRHARVAFTDSWAADARRRDFTINALYADADGALHDPLNALPDIEARRVRFIGEPGARIREDYLRILRFFRFNAELSAPPYDAEGLAACVRERGGLADLSAERVHAELMRLLAAPHAFQAIMAMFDNGLLVDVLARVPYLARLERLVRLEPALGFEADPLLRLAALTVAVPEDAHCLRPRLRLSNSENARLVAAADYRACNTSLNETAMQAQLYRAGVATYRDRVLLAWADSGASADDADWQHLLRLPQRWRPPVFPLRGQDLLALGLAKGPQIGEILTRLESEWVAGGFRGGREALLERARELLG